MISEKAHIGKNVVIKDGVIIEDNCYIGDNSYLDYNSIIKENVSIGNNSFIGANCILGEFLSDFITDKVSKIHPLIIGQNAVIRSGSIIYGDTVIGNEFSSGHRITIREHAQIGNHVNIGTLSDIQGFCTIGDYVHLHSNVHVGMKTTIKDFAWIFPYVVFTNDPTPPSEVLLGSVVNEFSVICTGSVILPGITIGKDVMVGASSNVTKDVPDGTVVFGNPAKIRGKITDIKDKNNQQVYPWRYTFDRGMPWKGLNYDEWEKNDNNVEKK